MAFESTTFGHGPAAHHCGRLFGRAGGAHWCLALLLCVTTACSEDKETSDDDDDGKSAESSTADDDDDKADDDSKDEGTKKDPAPSSKLDGGGMMRADTGRIDAGMGTTAKSDAGGAGTGAKGDSSVGSSAGGACTRESLKAVTDQYYTALAAHDPSMLPLADNVKFTENGNVLKVGEGLWKNAGMLKYKHSALDVESCSSVSESVVPDGSTDIPLGLRLKVEGQKITEIETIAVRAGDYKVGTRPFASNTRAIISSASLKWEESIPEGQRSTRAEIEGWLKKYFTMFPAGGCDFADDCQRLENGGGSFECGFGLSCSDDEPSAGTRPGGMRARLIVVDVETGIGVGFTMFATNTDFHMIKMLGGEIHAVHAILGQASGSGWD